MIGRNNRYYSYTWFCNSSKLIRPQRFLQPKQEGCPSSACLKKQRGLKPPERVWVAPCRWLKPTVTKIKQKRAEAQESKVCSEPLDEASGNTKLPTRS